MYKCSDPDLSNFVTKEELEELEKLSVPMISVTYNELKTLRDNSQLIPGQQYRITDYVTTTAQDNTRSAGHPFDVIVTADSENTLNEEARACIHEGDTYFSEAGAKLEAWQIWYSLDNDTKRFAWALSNDKSQVICHSDDPDFPAELDGGIITPNVLDEELYIEGSKVLYTYTLTDSTDVMFASDGSIYAENERQIGVYNLVSGKGVIYRMIDEWGNDCPYDFKNIQFKRNLNFGHGFAEFSEDGDETWVYTFAGQSYHINNDEWSGMLDGSLESPFGHMSDENTSTFHDNIIEPYIMLYNGNDIYTECGLRYLNDNVFLGYWEKIGSANDEDMPYYYAYCCHSNSFGNGCYYNSFGNNCYSNSFGNYCYYNSFGNYCYTNSFGNYCYTNSFGNSCYYNSFENDCHSNSLGHTCNNNSFGNNCHSNSFGNYCYYNSFGNGCYYNSFGNNCYSNSFGNYCYYNSFGNYCYTNSFGKSCYSNSFRLSPLTTASLKNYCYYNHFDDGCSYNVIWNSYTTSSSKLLKNINVNRGVSGTSSAYNFINIDTLNADYEIQVAKNSKGEIKIYCEADLIA